MHYKKILIAITCLCYSVFATGQDRAFQDWYSGTTSDGDGFYAGTANESGHFLGQYCYSTGCVYLLGLQTSCTKGNKYPVLVNASTGSKTVEVFCNGPLVGGRYQYVFTAFDEINSIVLEATRVGFAFPLRNDEFIVIRFSLMGSNEAIATMNKRTPPSRVRGTRDQRL